MNEQQVQRGQQWLESLLRLISLTAVVKPELNKTVEDLDSCWLTIDQTNLTSEQVQKLTGSGGSVLDSIQYLANTILNLGQDRDNQGAYTIELDGYRARRQAELKVMAEQAAEQVRHTGEEFEMKALSSAERRQVHTLLKEYTDLETYSHGQEPDRRLVVRRSQS